MVGPRVYHIKHARSYPAFTADDPAKVMDLAVQWLKRHDFRVKRKSKQYSRGSKKGIHVNFVPKFKLYIEQGPNGHYVVRFDYYAKIKLGTAVVVGVLTSGISTVVGVGTLAIALSDADNFVDKFWKHIDSLARGNPVILTVERWASDGKGGFVKQPLPPGTAVPAGGPTPPPPRQQPLPPPPPVYAPPPPPPPVHTDNRPRDTNPPQIQPGQVYGHSFIPTPVQASAPPPTPQYYPKLEKSNPPPPNNYHPPPPPHAAAYGNYPPPQSPHGHYPPPPSPHNAYGHPPPPPPHAPHAYQPPTPTGHAYPPPPPAHGYPPPPPAHNYQPPPPGGYPPPPSQQGQRASSSQLAQHRPPPAQNTQPSAPRRPPPTPQSNYGDSGQASHDGYAGHHDSYSAYYDSHGDRQSYYGGDAATEHSYYAAYTDPNGVYHEASYFEKRASTGSDDIPDSASSFAEQHGLGRYAEHHTNLRSSYYSDTKSTATNPSV